jgi:hypothetical protein
MLIIEMILIIVLNYVKSKFKQYECQTKAEYTK